MCVRMRRVAAGVAPELRKKDVKPSMSRPRLAIFYHPYVKEIITMEPKNSRSGAQSFDNLSIHSSQTDHTNRSLVSYHGLAERRVRCYI